MDCRIEMIEQDHQLKIGTPKEIVVDTYEWTEGNERGTGYTYHLSKERFDRPDNTAYKVYLDSEKTETSYLIATLSYYDFVDFQYEDCIRHRAIDEVAERESMEKDSIWELLRSGLDPLNHKIHQEFEQTEEYQAIVYQKQVMEQDKKARKKFLLERGFDEKKYERCYNVFGQLMNASYLNKLEEIVYEREHFSRNSKKKHKDTWRSFNESGYTGMGGGYQPGDKETLVKFYKVLAKKYHPDANPGIDTAKEMQLLNQIKKEWGI